MIRRFLWLLVLAAALAGCRRATRVDTGARTEVLHIGNGAEPKDLDPQTGQSSVEYTLSTALFEGLVDLANDGRTILPGVAQSWELSADGRVYTFHLRPDACWSDGTPLTAGDFLYSFRRVFTPTLGCENALYGFAISGARDFAAGKNPSPDSLGLRAPDARTFVVRLDYRTPYFLYILAGAPFVPVPRAAVERFGGGQRPGTAWTRPGNLISNGPFTLAAWRPNRDLIVAKNPRYWDAARVRLHEIHFYATDSADAEERAFRAGELHVTFSLPVSRLDFYRRSGGGQLHVTPLLDTVYLLFNTTQPPFTDPRIRRAFSLAIDRDRLIPLALHEAGAPAQALTRPGTDDYQPPRFPAHDPAEARRLLAAAGFPGGAGLPPIEFQTFRGFSSELAEMLQQVWQKELGVRATIAPQERNSYFDRLGEGKFQVAALGFFYAINAPETILLMPLSDSRFNFARWRSPAYDHAYAAAAMAARDSDRRGALDAMEGLIHAEAPYAPLYYVNQCYLVSPRVQGWRDNALGQIDWRELDLK